MGFLETAPEIINLWFHHHFPLAASVGQQLSALNASNGAGLHFTSPAWLVSLYLDCPQPYVREGVVCPNASSVKTFVNAIENGWITWYAYPFVTEVETMDASLFDFGIELAHSLDRQFNQSLKTVLSQRDVPGLTRSAIPLLTKQGVRTISVGVNGGSAPPNVPKAFIWKDPPSGEEVLALWLQGGYSGIQLPHVPFLVYTMIPNASSVLVVDWRGDNSGPPPSAANVLETWKWLAIEFPNAEQIIASTFDRFVQSVPIDDIRDNLPVITSEIGDTWIFGIASDPVKLAKYQLAMARRSECLAAVGGGDADDNERVHCSLADAHVWQFSRLLLKAAEHTWGLDQKVAIKPYVASNWSNADLQALLPQPDFVSFVDEWYRQRRMAIDDALELLFPHPLYFDIVETFKQQLTVPEYPPVPADWKSYPAADLPPSFPLSASASISFDPSTGAIVALSIGDSEFASKDFPLALLQYTTYDEKDYQQYAEHYNYIWPIPDDRYDQMKLNIDQDGAEHRDLNPTLVSVSVSPPISSASNTSFSSSFILELSFPSEVVQLAGAPASVFVEVNAEDPANIEFAVYLYNKTATRLPEALFFRFVPPLLPPSTSFGSAWRMNKLGEWVDPSDVVTGGSKHLHAIVTASEGLMFGGGRMNLTAPLSPLVCFGEPTGFPIPLNRQPDWSQGVSFVLVDNLWNTNYIQWTIDQDFVFRFRLAVQP